MIAIFGETVSGRVGLSVCSRVYIRLQRNPLQYVGRHPGTPASGSSEEFGAEFWTQVCATGDSIPLHFDKDEAALRATHPGSPQDI